jgi:ATP-dependent DNA helicase RecG
LIGQIDTVTEVLYTKYLKAKISYNGIQRIERYPFPMEALREAILNAVIHKDYGSGIPVQISVYNDKIYIANIGSLPEMWTVDNLLSKHTSKPFNPILARMFYLIGYIESWGRGVEKMWQACQNDGVPIPEYMINPTDIMLKFTAPTDRVVDTVGHNEGIEPQEKFPQKFPQKFLEQLTKKEFETVTLIFENPGYTSDDIANKVGITRRAVTKRLKILKEKGVIKRVGSDKGGYWEIDKTD